MKTSFDDLPFLPSVIADTVCRQTYTGAELLDSIPLAVAKIDGRRLLMTEDEIRQFAEDCDTRCRQAYGRKDRWFMKCVRAKGNAGRDQLYLFISHWLAARLS